MLIRCAKNLLLSFLFCVLSLTTFAQDTICINPTVEHQIVSQALNETRRHWVRLPFRYSDTSSYPVIYVFDAEWRFDLISNLVYDLGANKKIQPSIVVGIPHVDWKNKRGVDLTFSQSRIEYDGEAVDSTWYHEQNSGGAAKFYQYLINELIPAVNQRYATNQHETLIGHSYGGYFGGYLLSLEHPFEVLHIYDPSIWYSDGEVTKRFAETKYTQKTKIHLTYQGVPLFHKNKIEAFLEALAQNKYIELSSQFYPNDTHNALFIDSFLRGILQTNQ